DSRAAGAALKRDIDLSGQRARRVRADDFTEFDYVIAMDESNRDDLLSICPAGYEDRVKLFLDFSDDDESEVPDPYYGQGHGFEIVLDLVEAASDGLLDHIRNNH
ncbi:MAG TPA: low molecular weight phosphotyrosine protein phosphatase, partial [Gammaproteobacteria bacterium]|nr:low molecular weight phosphotyrosine protein phosphatase [Gammaproteobacteria bacterium]